VDDDGGDLGRQWQPPLHADPGGEVITGTYSGRFGEAPVTGTIKGNRVTMRFTVSVEGQEMKMEYAGTVEDDTMTGKVVFGGFGEGTFKGSRARPAQP
jgi:hypothetical protein